MNKTKLLSRGLALMLVGPLMLGAMLFLPAGTLGYGNAWLYLALLFLPMLLLGVVLFFKSPALLEKRLNAKEKVGTQKRVIGASGVMFLAMFVLSGLDFRFGWSHVPSGLVITAAVIQLLAYAMYAEVMRENAYLSRTIEVQEGQKVIDTGLYGIVRHPMYAATLPLFLAMPLVLGSWVAFAVMLVYPVLIAVRIRNEEAVLEAGLEGYADYKQRVKYRMIPFVW